MKSKVIASSYRVVATRKRPRPKRSGEVVCTCGAYEFPHRLTGGRCTGARFAQHHWFNGNRECRDCMLNKRTHCEVGNGTESVSECAVYNEEVRRNS